MMMLLFCYYHSSFHAITITTRTIYTYYHMLQLLPSRVTRVLRVTRIVLRVTTRVSTIGPRLLEHEERQLLRTRTWTRTRASKKEPLFSYYVIDHQFVVV